MQHSNTKENESLSIYFGNTMSFLMMNEVDDWSEKTLLIYQLTQRWDICV